MFLYTLGKSLNSEYILVLICSILQYWAQISLYTLVLNLKMEYTLVFKKYTLVWSQVYFSIDPEINNILIVYLSIDP